MQFVNILFLLTVFQVLALSLAHVSLKRRFHANSFLRDYLKQSFQQVKMPLIVQVVLTSNCVFFKQHGSLLFWSFVQEDLLFLPVNPSAFTFFCVGHAFICLSAVAFFRPNNEYDLFVLTIISMSITV
jgi:hypothetical protein